MVKRKRQTIQWSKEKDRHYNGQKKKGKQTDNTMVKRIKDRQYNGQKKMTDNTMVKRKRTNRQTIQWSKEKGQIDRQYNGQKN